MAEDERSKKSQFGLAVKIKRLSSQSAQLSAFLLIASVCIEKFKFSSILMPKNFTTFSC